MSDFARRRTTMVDTQVRPSDVTKFPIIEAMLKIQRELFVPTSLKEAAYAGENLAIGQGRVLLDPRTLAKMLEAVDVQPDEIVLDIACGLGYSSAVLAHLAEAVIAVEDKESLATDAENALGESGADNVAVVHGPLVNGAAKHGPYDAIMVQGGVEQVPEALSAQLKDGGRILAIFQESSVGVVKVGYKRDGNISWRFAFNGNGPLLAGFEKEAAFAL
ncbi:MAG: protein-L-isoaspartate O-methyltransferase [Boseongicola sp.]|nr:MAG: protein-L-isoaspartate O-methyltransferase [Boseongicola sp.]